MMTLPTRKVGPFEVSAISLGCMNLNHGYGDNVPEGAASRLLNRALDLGVTMLDTAALYGDGNNERLVSTVMHRRREFTLASKCVLGVFDGKRGLDGSPAAIAQTLDGALERLRTDHIDLYYLHRFDPKVPVEESFGALVRAKEAGKIGAIGISEMSAGTLRRLSAIHPVAAVQSEYSPASRNVEVAMLDACLELGTGFVAFSPVARGLLAGRVRSSDYRPGDIRASFPRYMEPQLSENLRLIDRFDALARDNGLTPAQLALSWVLAQGEHITALPGTANIAHLEEDVATLEKPVSADLIAAVTELFPPNALKGARYPKLQQTQVSTELLPGEELA
jgi:aryl-alcohol dehydrogenase-like predicted oxidoreductase